MATPIARLLIIGIFLLTALFSSEKSFAINEAPQAFTLDGQLFQPGSNTPLLDASAKIKVQVLNPAKTCVLYEEQQTVNTSSTDGYFNIQVGSVVGSTKRTGGDPGLAMSQVFQNSGTISATTVAGQTCPFNSYTPASADKRYFRIIVTPSATNVADTQSPDMELGSVPNALVAQSLQGLEKTNILQVVNNGATALTQANLEDLFTTPNYSTLQSLLSGSYVQTSASGAGLPAFASNPTSPPQGSIWYDSVTHEVKYQDNLGPQVLGVAGSGVSATGAFGSTPNSAGLSISGTTINMQPADATNPGGVSTGAQTIAGAKTFSSAASFTSAGTGVAVTNNATVGGTLGVTGNTTVGGTLGVTSTLSVGSSAIVGGAFQTNGNLYFNGIAATNPMLKRNTTALEVKLGDDSGYAILRAASPSGSNDVATKDYVDTATTGLTGKLAKSGDSMSGNLVMENQKQVRFSETTGGGSNYAAIQAPATLAADYTLTLPVDDGASGEVLTTNGSGVLSWTSAATGTVSTAGTFNATSTAKGLSISGSDVILHAADGTNPGAVTTGAQTLAGAKTFSSQVSATAAGTGLAVTNNATVGGTLGVTGNSTVGGTLGVTSNVTVGGTLGVTGAATFSSTGSFADNVTMANQKEVRFSEATGGGSEYVGMRAPAALGTSYVLTLPTDDGAADQVLKTDGSGNLSWVTTASGTVNAIGNFGSTPNTKGMTLSSGNINLEPADATNPGAVSTAAQTFAGAKTFSGVGAFTAAGTGLSVTNNATVGGTLAVTSNTTIGGTLGVTGNTTVSGTLGITGVTTHSENVIVDNEKEVRFKEATGSGANYIALKAPTTLGGDFTLTLPVDDGTADQILKTDGSGNLSWVTPAVTSGISVTAPITNSGTAAAPNIGISQATTSTNGYVSSTDWNTFNNKQTATLADGKILVGNASNVATAVSVTGDVAITNAGVTAVNKIKGITVSAAPTITGQVLRYDGTNLVPNFISMVDLRSTVTGTTALASACTAAQTLTYNTVGDNLTCSNIAIGDSAITYASQAANKFLASPSGGAGAPTYRTIAAADLPVTGAGAAAVNGGNTLGATLTVGTNDAQSLAFETNNATAMTILSGGNVGIGTTNPTELLSVNGYLKIGNAGAGAWKKAGGSRGVLLTNNDDVEWLNSLSGNGYGFRLYGYDPGGGTDLRIAGRYNSSTFTDIMTIKDSGNVGIGTSSPLRVFHTKTAGSTEMISESSGVAAATVGRIWRSRLNPADATFSYDAMNGDLSAGVAVITMKPDGYVGIGTVSPSYKLDVDNGAAFIAARVKGSGADSGVIRFENTSVLGGRTYHVGSTDSISGAGNGFSIYDITAAAPRFLINPSGNVGIGTTAPTQPLEVYASTPVLRLNSVGSSADISGYSGNLHFSTHSAARNFTFSGGATEVVRITGTGNVGIGTTSPAGILDITSTTKGVVLPRMTKVQRDAIVTPVAGTAIYQTDNTPGLRVFNGTNWMRFTETAD